MKFKAFTLVEMIVTVTILGILGAIAFTSIGGAGEKAKETAVKTSLNSISKAIEVDRLTNKRYMAAQDNLGSPVENGVKGYLGSNNSFNSIDGLVLNSVGNYTLFGKDVAYVVTFDGEYFAVGSETD